MNEDTFWAAAAALLGVVLIILVLGMFITEQIDADRKLDCLTSLNGLNMSAAELKLLCDL